MAGTIIVEKTVNREYDLPVLTNGFAFDLPRLRAAIIAMDADVAALFLSLVGFADLESPIFTGTPQAPTQLSGDSSNALATTAYVDQAVGDVDTSGFAPTVSPIFTGTPKAPTPITTDNSTNLATTAFVKAVINALIAAAPGTLDTLNELAAALGNDPNFATTMANSLAAKAPLASPALTGNPTAPTQAAGNNSTRIATTAFVQAAIAALIPSNAVGAVGTYALMNKISGAAPTPGATAAGSTLRYASADGSTSGMVPTGTWRCMGVSGVGGADLSTTNWLRI